MLFVAKNKIQHNSFPFLIGFYVVLNAVIIPSVNILYYFMFIGYMDTDIIIDILSPSADLEFICKMIYLVILIYLYDSKLQDISIIPKKYWNFLNSCTALCGSSLILFLFIMQNYRDSHFSVIYSFLASVLLIFLYILNYFFQTVVQNITENHRLALEQEKNKIELTCLLDAQKNIEEIKKFKHDIQNNFIIIKHMIIKKEYESAMNYLNKYVDRFDDISTYVQFDNIIVSAIINDKIRKYQDLNFAVKCFLPKQIALDSIDLCTILGNLIDNACEYYTKNEIFDTIYIKITTFGDSGLFMEIKNRYLDKELNLDTNKNDKDNHGYGIMNVRKTVENNNGTIEYKLKDNYFIVQILLPTGGVTDEIITT